MTNFSSSKIFLNQHSLYIYFINLTIYFNFISKLKNTKINFLVLIISILTVTPVFATNWIKYGSLQDRDFFYDNENIVIVKYKNEQGKNSKGIRIKTLGNFFQPTFRLEDFIFNQAIQSYVVIGVYDCYDSLVYDEKVVYSSAKNDRGTLVFEKKAYPEKIESLYFQLQNNKEIIEERRKQTDILAEKARRNGQDPKRIVDEYLPSYLVPANITKRESYNGWDIVKIIRKFCSQSQ